MEHLLVSGKKINGHQGFYDAPVIPFQHAETLTTQQKKINNLEKDTFKEFTQYDYRINHSAGDDFKVLSGHNKQSCM